MFQVFQIFTLFSPFHIKSSYRKFIFLLTGILFFTCVYMLFDDSHFSGINQLQETIRNEILEKNTEKITKLDRKKQNVTEPFQSNPILNSTPKETPDNDVDIDLNVDQRSDFNNLTSEIIEVKQKLKDDVKNELHKNFFQKFFERFYFACVTGTTLGYGDIFPRTNITKVFALLQLFFTIFIILL